MPNGNEVVQRHGEKKQGEDIKEVDISMSQVAHPRANTAPSSQKKQKLSKSKSIGKCSIPSHGKAGKGPVSSSRSSSRQVKSVAPKKNVVEISETDSEKSDCETNLSFE